MFHDTTLFPAPPDAEAPRQTVHRLVSQGDKTPYTEPQHLFGHMVRLAQPLMTDFQSDLWHDAIWLQQHASKVIPGAALTFHWYISSSHTWLGSHAIVNPYNAHRHYVFTLSLDEQTGWWTLVIDRED